AAPPCSTTRPARTCSATSSIAGARKGTRKTLEQSPPARDGDFARARPLLDRVLEGRRHGEHEDLDALFDQVGRLAGGGFPADRAGRGFAVVDAPRLLGEAPADVLGVLDHLPRRLHPEALALDLAAPTLARLRTASLAARRLGAGPVA